MHSGYDILNFVLTLLYAQYGEPLTSNYTNHKTTLVFYGCETTDGHYAVEDIEQYMCSILKPLILYGI